MQQHLNTWVSSAENHDFSIYNLPFGIFSTGSLSQRAGIAIGEYIVDLTALHKTGIFDGLLDSADALNQPFLNVFIALGKDVTTTVRLRTQQWLSGDTAPDNWQEILISQAEAQVHLPVLVGDYTDFYSSIEHATNLGIMFRGPENALMPNWRHLPVGYHGRASSIIPSGIDIHRPSGQVMPQGADKPVYQPSARLDFELEVGFVIGKDSELGTPIPVEEAEDYIFGLVLFNDWSARDIQKWEYVPLGPFLGKNFASSISPWIVTLEALEPFRVPGPKQEPEVLPYLQSSGNRNLDIHLQVGITPEGLQEDVVSQSNFKYMYWNMAQQIAHHTVNGCNLRIGDMMASGTISGKDSSSYGSMLEISKSGKKPFTMENGETRSFIEDGDTVTMRGYGEADGIRVGFGEVRTKVLPTNG